MSQIYVFLSSDFVVKYDSCARFESEIMIILGVQQIM